MLVYSGLKTDFMFDVEEDALAPKIKQTILEKMGRNTPESEYRSWENSMKNMFIVLSDPQIPDNSGVAIEYNIPQTAKRVDFIISGYDKEGHPSIVVIELKQWGTLKAIAGMDALVETFTGGANRTVVHPSYQAWSYAQLIKDYNSTVQDNQIEIRPCAYLHNYARVEKDPIDSEWYDDYLQDAPAFTKGQNGKLREYIKKSIVKGDNKEILYHVENGKIRPSKSLQDCIGKMMKGNPEFVMIDEQKVVYEEVLRLSMLCQKDRKKRTVICQGGPGTGKTVIAVNLLAELTQKNQMAQYVSKNSAPRQVYLRKLKGSFTKSNVDNMFKGSGSYYDAPENMAGTLIVDEAHRLNDKSGLFHNLGENQIKELIHASLCSVFFIDEDQRVTMDDIGSIDQIKRWALESDSQVYEMELVSQFRCNGSNGYLAWLDDVLQIHETANPNLDDIDFDIRICDTPGEVRDLIFEKNRSTNRARILAGYCWNWNKDEDNNTEYHDIKIGDFEMSWNLKDGAPFAVSDTSVNEIGCIHTSQGLEFDYAGIIIGEDMRFENGRVVTDFTKRAQTDQSLKGIKKLFKENPEEAMTRADQIIRNTYRTLMTRGMKGCYIYCVDPKLEKYLKDRLKTYRMNKGEIT
ncbi:MAG: DUF2075 domain-containing protein [Clostridiales bacterium]|nr:DUF2075 domain-containing protein [Clostridiales bacterium]